MSKGRKNQALALPPPTFLFFNPSPFEKGGLRGILKSLSVSLQERERG